MDKKPKQSKSPVQTSVPQKRRFSLKNLWSKLDGGKTYLGVLLWLIFKGLNAVEIISADQMNTLIWIAGSITGVGVGHKFTKALKTG